jgi:D-3-phosphoglycerate dehydrogenase
MVSQISSVLASEGVNIDNMLNKKRDNIAYNIIDVTRSEIDEQLISKLKSIEGVFMVRIIQK